MRTPKPTGEEYDAWVHRWDAASHQEKLLMCEEYEITYDSARHWRSASPISQPMPPAPVKLLEPISAAPFFDVDNKYKIDLDFVSFDIETTNLTADFSVVLCTCIKPFGKEALVFRADKLNLKWATQRKDDSAVIAATADELSKHAIVLTHYGQKFDIPYLRAKMVHQGLKPLPPMFGIDTWRIAKNNFKISSRRLANLGAYFEQGAKSGVEGNLWMEAGMNGSIEAMDAIVAHCIRDVQLLEDVARLSFPYMKSIPKL